jgi:hypothetical protein
LLKYQRRLGHPDPAGDKEARPHVTEQNATGMGAEVRRHQQGVHRRIAASPHRRIAKPLTK